MARQTLLDDVELLAPVGRFEFDVASATISWSPGCFRVHGRPESAGPPSVEEFQAMMHPDDSARMSELTRRVMERPDDLPDEGVRMTYRARGPDGIVRDVRFLGRLVNGTWAGVVEDVTELNAAERALDAHHAVALALLDWQGFDEGGVGLLRRMGTALGFEFGVLWVGDPDRRELAARVCWCAPRLAKRAEDFIGHTLGLTFGVGEGIPGRAWADGRPVITEDLGPTLTGERRTSASSAGLVSAIAIPTTGGEQRAVLTFYSRDTIRANAAMHKALSTIGLQLGAFLERRRAELGPRQLSDRELDVLRCAAEGLTTQQIAGKLFVSASTVKTHLEHIYDKLGVGDRAAAVAYALRSGLIA